MAINYHVLIRQPNSSQAPILGLGLDFLDGHPSRNPKPNIEELETPGVDGRAYRLINKQFPRLRFRTHVPYRSHTEAQNAMDRFPQFIGPKTTVTFRIGDSTVTLPGVIREQSELVIQGRLAGFGVPAVNVCSIAYTIVFDRLIEDD